jgi:hypothetical protein
MTIKEAQFELARLKIRQEQVEREVLAILNRGCLPLEEARQKMKALGVVTEISPEGIESVVVTTADGEKGYTGFPLWYPLYASMDDVFGSLETDMAAVKVLKKLQARDGRIRRPYGIEDADDGEGGYVAAHEKVFEKVGEYRANETKIEELDGALNSIGAHGNTESGAGKSPETGTTRSADEEIKYVLEMLQSAEKVEFHPPKTTPGGKVTLPGEYWIKTNSSVKDVEQFLTEKKGAGEIFIPDIRAFMKNHLKGKKGGPIAASFYDLKSKQV